MIPFNLLLTLFFDSILPFLVTGLSIFIFIFSCVILIEALILQHRFAYGSFGHSVIASLVMNVTSTILGFCLGFLLDAAISGFNFITFFFYVFFLSWVLSVASEGGVLFLLNRHLPARKIWQMSLVVNLVTYLMLPFLLLLPNLPYFIQELSK